VQRFMSYLLTEKNNSARRRLSCTESIDDDDDDVHILCIVKDTKRRL